MSKARYVADLLADSGDVKATKLDEFGALKDLSNVGTLPAALQSQLVGPAGAAGAVGAAGADGVGGSRDFVATGTLPNGQAVELMADGTVRAVSAPIIPRNIPSASNGVVFENITTTHTWQGFDVKIDSTNPDRFIVAYRNQTGTYGACVLGTVSGTTITFGAQVIFSSEATTNRQISFAPNSSGKFAISYRKANNTAGIKIGTISGTSITFGTEVLVSSATTYFHNCAFDLVDNNKLVAMYTSSNSTYIKVGTVSGTSVSFGSAILVGPSGWSIGLVKAVGTSKFIILADANLKIGTVSGSTLSLGTNVTFPWEITNDVAMAVNPIDLTSFIVTYKGKNVSNNLRNGTIVAGTISGTSITLGNYIEFFAENSTGARDHAIEFSPHSSGKFAYMYSEDAFNDAVVNTGSVSGTTITLDTITEIHTESDHNAVGIAFMSGGKFVYVTKIGNASNFTASGNPLGSAHVGQMQATGASTLNSLSYVGLSSAAYTDGQTASIILKGGVSENQSGLTAGSRYYIQGDGTLGTSEATPSVEAGLAVNATTLLLSGPAGEDGVTGAAGATGTTGAAGTNGSDGADSTVAGPTGSTGPAGTSALVLISQSTAPTSPALGQQWFDTSQGVLYEYLTDGTDSSWLDVSSGSQYVATSGLASTVSTTDPLMTTNPSALGHLWINSTTGEAYVCNDITTDGNNWINIGAINDGFNVGPFAATGGTGSAGGGYAYRTFTASSTFTTSKAGTIDFIIVAGGGGAGTSNGAAGAGAGGLVYQSNHSVALGTFNIIIGAGGPASTSVSTMPNVGNGDNSTAFGFTAIGGGGSGNESSAATKIGASGGSGGGGVRGAVGGSGTSGQGYAGGSVVNDGAPHYRGGGGGGAGGAGQNGSATGGGNAGLGADYSAWASTTSTGDNGYYASGGAAGSYDGAGVGGTSGSETAGGGGLGGTHKIQPELNGDANTGGGGGGHGHTGTQGGNGGSGIVIIRYAV